MYQQPATAGLVPNEQKQIYQTKQSQKPKTEQPATISFEYRQPPNPKQNNNASKQDIIIVKSVNK